MAEETAGRGKGKGEGKGEGEGRGEWEERGSLEGLGYAAREMGRGDDVRGKGPSDAELVERCLEGDELAWKELLERYADLIYAIPLRRGLGREMADEVFQSVTVTLAERLSLIDDPTCLPKWLMITTSRRCNRLMRKRRRALEVEEPERPPEKPDVEQVLLREDLWLHVQDAMQEIKERDREILVDLFFRGLTYDEVAERRGVARGSLGSLRSRTLAKLRKILEDRGIL